MYVRTIPSSVDLAMCSFCLTALLEEAADHLVQGHQEEGGDDGSQAGMIETPWGIARVSIRVSIAAPISWVLHHHFV